MPNAWVEHIREFAKRHIMSYGCALSNPECLRSYKKKKEPKKPGPTFSAADFADMERGTQKRQERERKEWHKNNPYVFTKNKK